MSRVKNKKQNKTMSVNQVVNSRENVHGNIDDNARVAIALEQAVETGRNWNNLSAIAKLCIKYILFKISRLVNGNPNAEGYSDNWVDIQGYALKGQESHEQASNDVTKNVTRRGKRKFSSIVFKKPMRLKRKTSKKDSSEKEELDV